MIEYSIFCYITSKADSNDYQTTSLLLFSASSKFYTEAVNFSNREIQLRWGSFGWKLRCSNVYDGNSAIYLVFYFHRSDVHTFT